MSLDSTFQKVLEKLGTLQSELGSEISEFMNVFKMIHGYMGKVSEDDDEDEDAESVSDKVTATGMITDEMLTIYEKFIEKYNELETDSIDGDAFTFEIESFTSDYLPQLPKLMYLRNLEENDNGVTVSRRTIDIIPQEKKGEKLIVKAEIKSGTVGSGFTLKDYTDGVRAELEKFVSPKVFKYFAGPVKDLDEINVSNDGKSFSKEFKELRIYKEGFSFLDYLLAFAVNPSLVKDEPGLEELNTDSPNSAELMDIAEVFDLYKDAKRPDDMNSLVVDIMENQKKINATKDKVGALRKKLYTYVSRDGNYSKILNSRRRGLYLTISLLVALIVTISVIAFVPLTTVRNDLKSVILASVSSLILSLHIIKQIWSMFSRPVQESFVNDANLGFVNTETDESSTKTSDRVLALANFIDKFSQVLSKEIKQEYFDALSDSQDKDLHMLQQLEKEHSVSSHFHQLKNNLTHFKINETYEHKRMVWNGILLTCIIGLLLALKLSDVITTNFTMLLSGILGLTYVTYCLISFKALMIRDKYDWDRYHWVVNKIETSDGGSCNGLSGFARK